MKVSSIKTFVPAIAMGVASLVSCSDPQHAARRYMEDKPYEEFQEVISTGNIAHTQSKLDSVAYKDLFLTTQAGKDSSNVAEYNKIAASMRGYDPNETNYSAVKSRIKQAAVKSGMTLKEFDKIDSGFLDVWEVQYWADRWAYAKFFDKKGLMDDQNFAKEFQKVSGKIKPTIL